MLQFLIVETTEDAFFAAMDEKLKEGYRVIAGATYIKSLITSLCVTDGAVLNDVEHAFTVAIRGDKDYFLFSKNLNTFVKEVNKCLGNKDNHIVTGSLAIDLIHLDNYVEELRVRQTYYCSCLYKE